MCIDIVGKYSYTLLAPHEDRRVPVIVDVVLVSFIRMPIALPVSLIVLRVGEYPCFTHTPCIHRPRVLTVKKGRGYRYISAQRTGLPYALKHILSASMWLHNIPHSLSLLYYMRLQVGRTKIIKIHSALYVHNATNLKMGLLLHMPSQQLARQVGMHKGLTDW